MELKNIKIIFFGRAGVGKTTIKRIFFERENPLLLLKNTFEPTIGADTSIYNFGFNLSVFDLAGQEINSWLTNEKHIFDYSDVIFIILDSTDGWDINIEIFQKVQDIIRNQQKVSLISLFFHKIDLLTTQQQEKLQENILKFNKSIGINVEIFLTSIKEKYLLDTFNALIRSLKVGLSRKDNSMFQDFLIKIEILKYFNDHPKLDLENLSEIIHIHAIDIIGYVKQMYDDNYLILDQSSKETFLKPRGKKIIEALNHALNPKSKDILLSERDYIKGVILADDHGIPILTYEYNPKFFGSLVLDKRYSAEPGIISMFFAQIIEFGKTLDYNGLSSFQFGGFNLKIVSLSYKTFIIVFFIDRINVDNGILS